MTLPTEGPGALALLVGCATVVSGLLVLLARSPRYPGARIDEGGLRDRWGGHTPFDAIEDASVEAAVVGGPRLVLRLTGGGTRRVDLGNASPKDVLALVLERAREVRTASALAPLARRGRPLREWLDALGATPLGDAYRGGFTGEMLADALEDTRAPLDVRASCAYLLAKLGDDAARERARLALHALSPTLVLVAFVLGGGELPPARIDRWLEELADISRADARAARALLGRPRGARFPPWLPRAALVGAIPWLFVAASVPTLLSEPLSALRPWTPDLMMQTDLGRARSVLVLEPRGHGEKGDVVVAAFRDVMQTPPMIYLVAFDVPSLAPRWQAGPWAGETLALSETDDEHGIVVAVSEDGGLHAVRVADGSSVGDTVVESGVGDVCAWGGGVRLDWGRGWTTGSVRFADFMGRAVPVEGEAGPGSCVQARFGLPPCGAPPCAKRSLVADRTGAKLDLGERELEVHAGPTGPPRAKMLTSRLDVVWEGELQAPDASVVLLSDVVYDATSARLVTSHCGLNAKSEPVVALVARVAETGQLLWSTTTPVVGASPCGTRIVATTERYVYVATTAYHSVLQVHDLTSGELVGTLSTVAPQAR